MRYRAGVPTSSFLLRFHPVAVVATTLGSGFVEMIHYLPIHHPKFKIQNQYSASMLPDNRHFDFCVSIFA
jgi:hypothetical protein